MTRELNAPDSIDELLLQAKLAEDELHRLQEELITFAGHEFRTPLTIIDTAARRLDKKAGAYSPEEIRAKSAIIRTTVTRLVALVERTIEVSKLVTAGMSKQSAICPLKSQLSDICRVQQLHYDEIDIHCDVDDAPETIDGDCRFIEVMLERTVQACAKMISGVGRLELSAWSEAEQVVISCKALCEIFTSNDFEDVRQQLTDFMDCDRLLDPGMEFKLSRFLVEMQQGEFDVITDVPNCLEIEIRLPVRGKASPVTNQVTEYIKTGARS